MTQYLLTTSIIFFSLTFHSFAEVSGVIRNDLGEPVADAVVWFVESDGLNKEAATVTDGEGKYTLPLTSPTKIWNNKPIASSEMFGLMQNIPNPVSLFTYIPFSINETGVVHLAIYNLKGKMIKQLVNELFNPGAYQVKWDRTNQYGATTAEGTYVYRLNYNGKFIQKLLLVTGNSSGNTQYATQDNSKIGLAKQAATGAYDIRVYGKGFFPLDLKSENVEFGLSKDFTVTKTDMWDSNKVILRSPLTNTRKIIESGDTCRVVFLGGSITAQGGWRDNATVYLNNRFPNAKFEFINAGIGSAGSRIHAFRLYVDIFFKGRIDLLFLESTVNDANYPNIDKLRSTEGLIHQAQTINPNIDIIMQYFATSGIVDKYRAGDSVTETLEYEQVGRQYGISAIHSAHWVADHMTWQDFGSNVHPGKTYGHYYSDRIATLFNTAWATTLPEDTQILPHHIPQVMLDTFSYRQGRDEGITAGGDLNIVNGWTIDPSWEPLSGATRPGFTKVPMLVADPGAELTLSFQGPLIGICGPAGVDVGKVEYDIDGIYKDTINLLSHPSVNLPRSWIFKDELDEGTHQLTLKVLAEKADNSSGFAARIKYFIVNTPR